MTRDEAITRAYRRLARSDRAVAAAMRARNVATALLGHRLADGIEFAGNGEEWLARLTGPHCSVLVDVGANRGDWTEMFLRHAPGVQTALVFEPSGSAYAKLHARFEDSSIVELVNAAAGDQIGELPFFEESGAGETSSLVPGVHSAPGRQRTVPVTRLDEELGRRGISHVDFCKVDAEGYDLRVLRGAGELVAERRIDLIQFEYNAPWAAAGSTLGDALALLTGHGYEILLLKSEGLYRFDYERYGELFTYSNFVAVAPGRRDMLAPHVRGSV